ncbi:MAG: bifunctional diaminohydroxyphosphoribosylaminopyrimidine deaminase/5-amino-6-(5-phosphoribosylamino)uracil reductase RibD [Saprospiraceae bacterium]|jgi:diaminohydroxyphosphoribosylaminopyrimidine deaminase/5-amino-6-(5-phosphoribosylamino)uracil reductase
MPFEDEKYMRRCFDLARLGTGRVSPNPMVGAVLVYENRIIGEGYHAVFGKAHAEVNAIHSVVPADRALIPRSTLYVSLEPCCVYGKTPPCSDLILEHRIPRVVVSCLDFSPLISGRGVEQLRRGGVQVTTGVLEEEGLELSRPAAIFLRKKRPYIILKWAETQNGLIAPSNRQPFWISGAASRRLTHKWRMEADAILVGTTTALHDDPSLDNRYFFGKSPVPVLLDRRGMLPPGLKVFQHPKAPVVFVQNGQPLPPYPGEVHIEAVDFERPLLLDELLQRLYLLKIGILLVEGGAAVLQSFVQQGLWDEARVIHSTGSFLADGLPAPSLSVPPAACTLIEGDEIRYFRNEQALNLF